MKMTQDEMLAKVLEIFPDAEVSEDNYCQVVIYTACEIDDDGYVVPSEKN